MTRLFLFGTLMWDALRAAVAGRPVPCVPATLGGWHVARATAGDWPVLLAGGTAQGLLTAPLPPGPASRLDHYEAVYGYGAEAVEVLAPDGPVAARVYRAAAAGAGTWSLDAWIAARGALTLLAAEEILRSHGREPPAAVARRLGQVRARAQATLDARAHRRATSVGQTDEAETVHIVERGFIHDGFHRVERWTIDHPRFDGTRSGPVERAISHVSDAATVLPYDPGRDRVLLVEQIRIGALAKGDPLPWLLEPVAGLIDAGETAATTALRELEEEAGLRLAEDALRLVARYYPSPGGLAQVLTSFIALCDLPDGAARQGGLDAEDEDIRGHLVGLDALLAMVASGEAANAPLILSAQWLALHRDGLRTARGGPEAGAAATDRRAVEGAAGGA